MKKSNYFVVSVLSIMFLLPFVSADLITPGFHGISINNVITNVNDFPDYIFISAPTKDGGPGLGMCSIDLLNENGKISGYYKFCSISVYAIPKEKFNQTIIDEINNNTVDNYTLNEEKFTNYLSNVGAKEVIKNIDVYTEVPDASPTKSITNSYTIDLNQTKSKPDNNIVDRNYLIYLYILIPIIAIIIIFLIIKKRR